MTLGLICYTGSWRWLGSLSFLFVEDERMCALVSFTFLDQTEKQSLIERDFTGNFGKVFLGTKKLRTLLRWQTW